MSPDNLSICNLNYILIAVKYEDICAPFRTFFDNWFAYQRGGPFLNRNGRPHWFNNPCPIRHREALSSAHFVSVAAAHTLNGLGAEQLVKDHSIPVSVLRDLLFEKSPDTVEEVEALMTRYYRIGVITHDEHGLLGAQNLNAAMPEGWVATSNPFLRYEQAGIQHA